MGDSAPRPRTALIVPVLNEEEAIGAALARVPWAVIDVLIVVDGGSDDSTVARACAAGARVIEVGPGYGRACLAGAQAAEDCEILTFMDGDGADRPEVLPDLIAPLLAGEQDFVIGTRTRALREAGSLGLHQVLAGRLVGLATACLYGVRYTDMAAFRAIRRDQLLSLGMSEFTYGWNLEMQMRAARNGLRILEIPVPYGRRAGGAAKVAGSLRGSLRAGLRLTTAFLKIALSSNAATPEQVKAP